MAAKGTPAVKAVDGLLKALLILSRTVEHALETEAVQAAVHEPFSGSKVQILRLLGTRASQTSSQIARFLGVSKPAVTQLVDSMVRRKLVVRKTAKHDRREVDLFLTHKGQQLFQAVRREQRHVVRTAIREGGGTGAQHWIETLGKVTDALAQGSSAFEDFCLQCGAHTDGTCVLGGGDAECLFLRRGRTGDKAEKRTDGRLR
ncbi:MAG: MarR family transcriptional regulator [Planctomycetota bacterium]